MEDVKWVKITTDMFDNRKIKQIECLPDGDTLIVIWVKLICLSGSVNANGFLFLTKEIPYTDQMLAAYFNRPLATVQMALKIFEQFGMIQVINDIFCISNWEKYQNTDGLEKIREKTRKRVAAHRERQKQLLECNVTCNVTNSVTCNDDVTQCNAIDIEEDIDIEKEKENIKEKEAECNAHEQRTKKKSCLEKNVEIFTKVSEERNFTENQKGIILDWIGYKSERGDAYVERGMSSLMTTFEKSFSAFGDTRVKEIVDYSISNMYAGIVWDRLKKEGGNGNGTGRISIPTAEDAEKRWHIDYA